MNNQDLQQIIKAIESRNCLAFVGAGASAAYRDDSREEVPGLPTGGALARWLAEQCDYKNGSAFDLLKVAEFCVYTDSGDRRNLENALQEIIFSCGSPRPIHTVLAQLLHIKFVITSNYDTLLEQELARYGRHIRKHVYHRERSTTGHFQVPFELGEKDIILHKMHGSIDEPESMVITESDYIQYLANLSDMDRGMPEIFRKNIIPQYTLLFLGYGLADWNFRVIWEGVLSQQANKNLRKDAYALVRQPDHYLTRYWAKRNVFIFDEDLTQFAVKIAQHFNLEIPQLEIEKQPEPRR